MWEELVLVAKLGSVDGINVSVTKGGCFFSGYHLHEPLESKGHLHAISNLEGGWVPQKSRR